VLCGPTYELKINNTFNFCHTLWSVQVRHFDSIFSTSSSQHVFSRQPRDLNGPKTVAARRVLLGHATGSAKDFSVFLRLSTTRLGLCATTFSRRTSVIRNRFPKKNYSSVISIGTTVLENIYNR